MQMSSAMNDSRYTLVAASQPGKDLSAKGGRGDYLAGILVIPASTSPGGVKLHDHTTEVTVFNGGAPFPLADLKPFWIPLGMTSSVRGWKVTTGAALSVIAF